MFSNRLLRSSSLPERFTLLYIFNLLCGHVDNIAVGALLPGPWGTQQSWAQCKMPQLPPLLAALLAIDILMIVLTLVVV